MSQHRPLDIANRRCGLSLLVQVEALKRAKILVVDDNADSRLLLREYVAAFGHESLSASSGMEALTAAAESHPDLILLDLLMPQMDGHETLTRLKSDPDSADIPVIVVSALDDTQSITRCLGSGAEDYITKPIVMEVLRARCSVCLERKRIHDSARLRLQQMEEQTESLKQNLLEKSEELINAYRRLADNGGTSERTKEEGINVDRGLSLQLSAEERERLRTLAQREHGILTNDDHLIGVIGALERIAASDSSVFVQGETGTGKELVARAVHKMSARRRGPFIAINCATLSPELLRAELFGHVRGSFTGAIADRAGLIAEADGGTLLLDEVAELDMEAQAMLLRFLQDHVYRRVGSNKLITGDVRVLSATHVSLEDAVERGTFRSDLMYRLRVIPVFLPPLRERRADILPLWNMYLTRNAKRLGHTTAPSSPALEETLLAYSWPGNVRELMNAAELVAALAAGREPTVGLLPPRIRQAVGREQHDTIAGPSVPPLFAAGSEPKPGTTATPAPRGRQPLTLEQIEAALEAENGNVTRASKRLGISRVTLWKRRKQLREQNES